MDRQALADKLRRLAQLTEAIGFFEHSTVVDAASMRGYRNEEHNLARELREDIKTLLEKSGPTRCVGCGNPVGGLDARHRCADCIRFEASRSEPVTDDESFTVYLGLKEGEAVCADGTDQCGYQRVPFLVQALKSYEGKLYCVLCWMRHSR